MPDEVKPTKPPQPVHVTNPVEVVMPSEIVEALTEPMQQPSLPPTTTRQADLVVQGQRFVSYIWELSQSFIALTITAAVVYTAVKGISSDVLTNAFFLIIGFYFSRQNHTAIGGVGPKATDNLVYKGR